MLYCRPRFIDPSGLGNRLFPWARCLVFAEVNQARMLSPRWSQLDLGNLLRGKPRFYHDLFRSNPAQARSVERLLVENRALLVDEPAGDFRWSGPVDRKTLVSFSGDKDFFGRLHGWESFLRTELEKITRPLWLSRVTELAPIEIGIHIRRGDFTPAKSHQDFIYRGFVRTPLEWFAETLRQIRRAADREIRASVFSDGSAAELRPLLELPGVRLVQTGSAVGDLLLLSKSKLLIASGGSTFSAWASFLGGMPTVAHPGQALTWYQLQSTPERFQGAFDPAAPPSEFLEQAARLVAT